MRWQQRLRIGIAVFGVAFLAVLYVSFRGPKPSVGPPEGGRVTRGDPAASAESTSGDLLSLVRDVEQFRLEYDRLLTYPDGRQKLFGARVLVPNRGGRDVRIKADEANVGSGQDQIEMRGAVRLESSDGLVVKTDAASYSQGEGVLRAPGPTSFSKGRVSGASVGMTYDKSRDLISLLDQAAMSMMPARTGDPPVQITSGSAFFARADRYVRYERGFTLVSGTRTLASTLATAYLNDDGSRVETLEMRGQSSITGAGEGTGALRSMNADDINLEFSPDGQTLAGATLSSARPGRATVELSAGASSARTVAGQWIDVRFGPDGTTVTALTVRESVELSLPPSPQEPPRWITAAVLTASAEGGSSLTAARFVDNVEYREAPLQGSPRTVRARTLDVTTEPGLGAISDARFAGGVTFEEGRLRASSDLARYMVDRGRLELDGADPATGQVPRVTDGQVSIDAAHVDITLDPRRITARDDVRSMMLPASNTGGRGEGSVKRAGMLEQEQPVYATSAALDYDGSARLAIYTSAATRQARLWQGDTTIQADQLTVNDATGDLAAAGRVATTLFVEQRDDKTQKAERVPSIGSAEEFLYEDALRRATYTGSAHVSGPQGDLRAARIEMYLAREGHELDKVEAYAGVSMRDAARKASGDRLTYVGASGQYVVVGSPVKIEADCRETTGRTLVFYKSTSNIVVEPSDEFRTQVKAIPKCGEPGQD